MTSTNAPPPHLGFLTVLRDASGYHGGYLVTNLWGRPLEFRLSTAVQPNKVQQILYGTTLDAYVCGEVIGRTLVEKTATPVQVVLTDCAEALQMRRVLDVPVVWVNASDRSLSDEQCSVIVRAAGPGRGALVAHPAFASDVPSMKELFERLAGLDVAEPFVRIREAVAEARKMGVTQRAA